MAVRTLTSKSAAPVPEIGRPRAALDWRDSFFWMVAVAFLLRLAAIVIFHTYRYGSGEGHFSFGYEMGRIAAAIASGHGFSNPFQIPTGPTAWEPPLYPYLTAGIFRLFGIYSHASAFVLLTINSFFSALTTIPIYLIGKRTFDHTVALWSAWLWAVLPFTMYWSTKWVWETSLAALLLALAFLIALELAEQPTSRKWLGFGLLWGVAALNNPTTLSFLPFATGWIVFRSWRKRQPWLLGSVYAGVVMLAVVSPWLLRNYRVFGRPLFIRDNFGAELRLGNGPGADGLWMAWLHPTWNPRELQRYQQLGEPGYVAERRQEALQFISRNPRQFATVTMKRIVYFWAGVPRAGNPLINQLKASLFLASSVLALWGLGRAVRLRKPAAFLYASLLLAYPIVYYIAYPQPRYRHPIEPEMLLLAVYLICEAGAARGGAHVPRELEGK